MSGAGCSSERTSRSNLGTAETEERMPLQPSKGRSAALGGSQVPFGTNAMCLTGTDMNDMTTRPRYAIGIQVRWGILA